jgi:hypothetical protein
MLFFQRWAREAALMSVPTLVVPRRELVVLPAISRIQFLRGIKLLHQRYVLRVFSHAHGRHLRSPAACLVICFRFLSDNVPSSSTSQQAASMDMVGVIFFDFEIFAAQKKASRLVSYLMILCPPCTLQHDLMTFSGGNN